MNINTINIIALSVCIYIVFLLKQQEESFDNTYTANYQEPLRGHSPPEVEPYLHPLAYNEQPYPTEARPYAPDNRKQLSYNSMYNGLYNMYQDAYDTFVPTGPLGAQQHVPYWFRNNQYPMYQWTPQPSSQYPPQSPYPPLVEQSMPRQSNLYQQPLSYANQLYPKVPWYPKEGSACYKNDCGATGTCVQGVCRNNNSPNTAFNVPIN